MRELHLCDTGDEHPDDPPVAEWSCHDWSGTLGHNVAVASALCFAHVLGFAQGTYVEREGHVLPDHAWRPGCGHAAPVYPRR